MSKRKNNTERRLEFVKIQSKLGESENALRAKYIEMRDGKIISEENYKDIFKPISTPIYKLLNATFEKVKKTDGSIDYIPRFVTPKNISDFSDTLTTENKKNTDDLVTGTTKGNQKIADLIDTTNRRSKNIEALLIQLNVTTNVAMTGLAQNATPEEIRDEINDQVAALLDISRDMDNRVERGQVFENEEDIENLIELTTDAVDDRGAIEQFFDVSEDINDTPLQIQPPIDDTPEDINDTPLQIQPPTDDEVRSIVNRMLNIVSWHTSNKGRVSTKVSQATIDKRINEINTHLEKFLQFYVKNGLNTLNRGEIITINGKPSKDLPTMEEVEQIRMFIEKNQPGQSTPIGINLDKNKPLLFQISSSSSSPPSSSSTDPKDRPRKQSTQSSSQGKKKKGKGVYGNGLIDFKTGLFSGSPLKVDMNLLKNNHLKVSKNGVLMINKKVDPDTVAILTTPSHAMKKYSPLAIKTFQDMYKMSKSVIGSGCDKERFINMKNVLLITSPTDAVKKLEIINGAMNTGNTSDVLKGQASEIIDYLLKEKKIDKTDHKALFNKFMII